MRYLAVVLLVCVFSTVCKSLSSPNTPDTNAAFVKKDASADTPITTSSPETNMPPSQSQAIQSQAPVSDFETAKSSHNKSEGIVSRLSRIPDVVWAAVIASGLTYIGVILTNRGNRKCLLLQLNHATRQEDKKREMQIRKDTYIESAEAIAESIQDIQLLPTRIANSTNIEIGTKLLPALAKIHMVGTLETIRETSIFMEKFNQITLPIVPEISRFAILKQEIASLKELSEYQVKRGCPSCS
jgi:hypothetical protein